MSILVYDGSSVVADRRVTHGGLITEAVKLWKVEDYLIGGVGTYTEVLQMREWWEKAYTLGKEVEQIFFTKEVDFNFVSFAISGEVMEYANCCIPIPVLEKKMAWGSGRGYALGAMAMGAGADTAARIAHQFDAYCGPRVDKWERVFIPDKGYTWVEIKAKSEETCSFAPHPTMK